MGQAGILRHRSSGCAKDALRTGAVSYLLPSLCALLLAACTFRAPPAVAPDGPRLPFGLQIPPVSPLVESSSNNAFEDPGSFVAYQGVGCAESDQSVAPRILLVKQSQEIPSTLSHAND
jgi:hypothetical protein